MSTSTYPQATTATDRGQFAARMPVWLVSVTAVVVGAVVTGVYEVAARATGVPFDVAFPGSGVAPAAIPATGLAWAVAELGLVGVILAVCLARFAKRPRSTWKRTTLTLTAISCIPSLIAVTDSYATNIMLVVSHLVAAAVIIPTVAARLAERNPRRG
ncbi:hypothetical protein FB381_3628 [Nocardioides albertanoniae]|uniref:Uncharacterized protein n=1 Tax=Nocardioides albertanoniae TaxID=1175486 RepID=A0A543AAW4_9ACTN|nr:DUF6069 family protein [Nocardioides albertanoniae]TQL69715.1 hypothetical protein FB381_3628 [Nocardioides albertanoniae]